MDDILLRCDNRFDRKDFLKWCQCREILGEESVNGSKKVKKILYVLYMFLYISLYMFSVLSRVNKCLINENVRL